MIIELFVTVNKMFSIETLYKDACSEIGYITKVAH